MPGGLIATAVSWLFRSAMGVPAASVCLVSLAALPHMTAPVDPTVTQRAPFREVLIMSSFGGLALSGAGLCLASLTPWRIGGFLDAKVRKTTCPWHGRTRPSARPRRGRPPAWTSGRRWSEGTSPREPPVGTNVSKCLLAEPGANGKPITCFHARNRLSWVESSGRAPPIFYCASVSPIVRCVSPIVRRTPASVSADVRRKRCSIARREMASCRQSRRSLDRLPSLVTVTMPGEGHTG